MRLFHDLNIEHENEDKLEPLTTFYYSHLVRAGCTEQRYAGKRDHMNAHESDPWYGSAHGHKTLNKMLNNYEGDNSSRRACIEYFLDMFEQKNTNVFSAMRSLLFHEAQISDDLRSDRSSILTVRKHYPGMMRAYTTLEQEFARDERMHLFANAIHALTEDDEEGMTYAWYGHAFEPKASRIVTRLQTGERYIANTSLKGMKVMELGLVKLADNELQYGKEYEHGRGIRDFLTRHDYFVDPLTVLFSQALCYRNRKLWGLPVCLPTFNDEGRFMVRNAEPLASDIDDPTLFSLEYCPDDNKIILGGAHSGGKTELLSNIGVYHRIAMANLVLFCDEAHLPRTDSFYLSYDKESMRGHGSLSAEIHTLRRDIQMWDEHTLALLDEFLDTAKPEIAARAEKVLLKEMAATPGPVIIVDHRASSLTEDSGFRFKHPELILFEDYLRAKEVPEE